MHFWRPFCILLPRISTGSWKLRNLNYNPKASIEKYYSHTQLQELDWNCGRDSATFFQKILLINIYIWASYFVEICPKCTKSLGFLPWRIKLDYICCFLSTHTLFSVLTAILDFWIKQLCNRYFDISFTLHTYFRIFRRPNAWHQLSYPVQMLHHFWFGGHFRFSILSVFLPELLTKFGNDAYFFN